MNNRFGKIVSVLFLFLYLTICNWIAGDLLSGWRNIFIGLGEYFTFDPSAFIFLAIYLFILIIYYTAVVSKDWTYFWKHGWKLLFVLSGIRAIMDFIFLFVIGHIEKHSFEDLVCSNIHEIIFYFTIYLCFFRIWGKRRFLKEVFMLYLGRNILAISTICMTVIIYIWIVARFYGTYEVGKTFYYEQLDLLTHNMVIILMYINEWMQCIIGTCLFFLFKNSTMPKQLIKA